VPTVAARPRLAAEVIVRCQRFAAPVASPSAALSRAACACHLAPPNEAFLRQRGPCIPAPV